MDVYRQATSGQYGWTVALQDGRRRSYECAGHDYLMDVISEKDLAPGFPVSNTDSTGLNVDQLSSPSHSTDIYGSVESLFFSALTYYSIINNREYHALASRIQSG